MVTLCWKSHKKLVNFEFWLFLISLIFSIYFYQKNHKNHNKKIRKSKFGFLSIFQYIFQHTFTKLHACSLILAQIITQNWFWINHFFSETTFFGEDFPIHIYDFFGIQPMIWIFGTTVVVSTSILKILWAKIVKK